LPQGNPVSGPAPTPSPPRLRGSGWRFWSVATFALVLSSVGIRAYLDLSRPGAWDYWKDQYLSPSLTASRFESADQTGRRRHTLAVSGQIGAAAADWFRGQIEAADLSPGDVILLSSPGGDLNQAIVIGSMIRARGLATAVGVVDASGKVRPASCASACVLVFAGGNARYGIEGSTLGVHRFYNAAPLHDPVADTQRITGMVLGYMTRMGVSSSVVEAMSQTGNVRWLGRDEALAMNLITDPVAQH